MEKAKNNFLFVVVLHICLTSVSVFGDDPISHWTFDEGTGTTAYDSAGNNDGTIYGAQWTTGIIDGALDFNGVNDYVDVGDPIDGSLDFGATDSFSISAWVKTADENGQIVYKRKYTGVGGYQEGYRLRLLWNLLFGIEDTSGNGISILGDTMVADDQWHHVVAVRDTAEDKVYLYLDGTSDATPVTDTTTETLATDRSLEIGRADATVSPYLSYHDGKIDDVRIYDRALSAEEIEQLYLPPLSVDVDIRPGSCPNPLNVKSKGVLPVAILGTESFDVYSIDAVSILLAGVDPIRSAYEDVTGPVADGNECECTEEGPDGYTDLTLKFKTQEIVEALVDIYGDLIEGDVLVLSLTGVLSDGIPIEGADCVRIVGKVPRALRAKKSDISEDGIVNMVDFSMMAEYWLESADF